MRRAPLLSRAATLLRALDPRREPLRPVYRCGDQLVRAPEAPSAELRRGLRAVLAFYEVPCREDDRGELWVARRTARDLDTVANFTSKASDRGWLERHRPARG